MSIIYDALKKVEKSGEPALKDNKVTPSPKNKIKNYLIYILFLVLGLFASKMFFSYLNRQPYQVKPAKQTKTTPPVNNVPKPPPLQQPKLPPAVENIEVPAKPTLILNGVFSSGEESYALINNQIVKLGDKINGAVIKKITPEEVLLDSEGSEIRLPTNH